MSEKVLASNRKAHFEFFLLEHYEAGISLQGSEIKSVRAGKASISEAYIDIDGKNAWLVNAHIAPYEEAARNNHEPKRPRRLLLHKKEIRDLWDSVRKKGLTIIPVKIYLKKQLAKVDIALARGKKLYDKREDIAKKDQDREMRREVKKKGRPEE